MVTSTAIVNETLDKISSATLAAKRAEIEISTAFEGDIFCCVAMNESINKAIDLKADNANEKLNALLQSIYAVIPVAAAMSGAH
jgi:hypothetical protein